MAFERVELGPHVLFRGDALEVLPTLTPVDALLTDPPYGIGLASNPIRQRFARQQWDNEPPSESALRQCLDKAKEAVIWGGNYFDLPPSKGWLIWDKMQPENFTLAMCELAWTNIDRPAKMFRKHPSHYEKFHPTQKPVELMKWCLGYLPTATTVLDPFMGSGTTAVACESLGRSCVGIEREAEYFDIACKRIEAALNAEPLLKEVVA